MDGSAVLDRADLDTDSPVPLHHQLSSAIAQRVRTGLLPSGARLPAVVDLCQSLNLSITTVNRSLQDLKRQGYVTTRRGHGTFVASIAAPTTEVIIAIGYEARGVGETFFGRIIDGLRQGESSLTRRHVLTQFPDYFPDAREMIELCRLRRSDSIVIYRPPAGADQVLAAVARQKAVVTLLRAFPETSCDSVLSAPETPLADWMRRRCAEGRRSFVYVGKTCLLEEAAPYRDILLTFEQTCAELGVQGATRLHPPPPRAPGDGRQIAVDDASTADAAADVAGDAVVVAQTPHIAAELLRRCPGLTAVSYTESESTVREIGDRVDLLYLDMERVGRAAAESILRRLGKPEMPAQSIRLTPELLPATGQAIR